jgi:hypothetical protein
VGPSEGTRDGFSSARRPSAGLPQRGGSLGGLTVVPPPGGHRPGLIWRSEERVSTSMEGLQDVKDILCFSTCLEQVGLSLPTLLRKDATPDHHWSPVRHQA